MIDDSQFSLFRTEPVLFTRPETESTPFGAIENDSIEIWKGEVDKQTQPSELRKLQQLGIEADVLLYAPDQALKLVKIQDRAFLSDGEFGEVVETDVFNNKIMIKLRG